MIRRGIMEQISVPTKNRIELIDITSEVRKAVKRTGVEEGICYVYVPF